MQWVQGWVGSVLTGSEIFGLLPGRWQACILSSFGSEYYFLLYLFDLSLELELELWM